MRCVHSIPAFSPPVLSPVIPAPKGKSLFFLNLSTPSPFTLPGPFFKADQPVLPRKLHYLPDHVTISAGARWGCRSESHSQVIPSHSSPKLQLPGAGAWCMAVTCYLLISERLCWSLSSQMAEMQHQSTCCLPKHGCTPTAVPVEGDCCAEAFEEETTSRPSQTLMVAGKAVRQLVCATSAIFLLKRAC